SRPPAPGALSTALARVGPDISVDDHRLWLDRLLAWVDAVRLGALAVLACAVVGIVLTVALATRAALAIHRDVIEILHMIGAQDRYIARQFQRQALWMGLRGGLVGAVLATLLILFVGSSGSGMQPGLLPALALGAREWAAIAALPLGSAAIALLVARLVVMRALRLMM
ncbi:MAG: cell division protein FtsX, partial [Alphaproteobacteria bacterium]